MKIQYFHLPLSFINLKNKFYVKIEIIIFKNHIVCAESLLMLVIGKLTQF